jgi:hypothetical protein
MMMKFARWVGYFVLALVGLGALLWGYVWMVNRPNELARPTGGQYEIPGGAVQGGPKPGPDGYTVNSAGMAQYLPIMPPDRVMNIHHAETEAQKAAIKSCFWPTARTRSGYLTTDTNNPAVDNQLPDTGNTYQLTALTIPAGAHIVVKGEFPHVRHWNFVTYSPEGIPRDGLADRDIVPDPGSQNPFQVGTRRDTPKRNYTFSIVSGEPTTPRPANTVYTRAAPGEPVGFFMRNYVPDGSKDFYGGVALPTIELHTADGKVLQGEEACAATNAPMRGKQPVLSVNPKLWVAMTHLFTSDATTAPAKPFEVEPLEMFFNRLHLVTRLFFPSLPTAKFAEQKGGFWSNADTRYGYKFFNQQHGKVYALRGKSPKTPPTWHGQGGPLEKADMSYWSVCTVMGMAQGMAVDCVYDEIVEPTLDAQRKYTIVISRAVDRPANATEKCGAVWMEWGNGDGIIGGSPDYGALVNRHTEPAPDFKHSWFAVEREGMEKQAMGDYLPYMVNFHEKKAFEALGCPIDASKIDARINHAKAPH